MPGFADLHGEWEALRVFVLCDSHDGEVIRDVLVLTLEGYNRNVWNNSKRPRGGGGGGGRGRTTTRSTADGEGYNVLPGRTSPLDSRVGLVRHEGYIPDISPCNAVIRPGPGRHYAPLPRLASGGMDGRLEGGCWRLTYASSVLHVWLAVDTTFT